MECSDTGVEIWVLFVVSSVLLTAFVFRTRRFIEWLRVQRVSGGFFGNAPDFLFGPAGPWLLRALGVIPAVMWLAGVGGVYCFFHGPG